MRLLVRAVDHAPSTGSSPTGLERARVVAPNLPLTPTSYAGTAPTRPSPNYCLMLQVSFYPESFQPEHSYVVQIVEALVDIKSGHWRSEVEAVRAQPVGSKPHAEAKRKLPSFTASGTFSRREAAGLLTHSGLLCLDLDAKGANTTLNFAAVRQAIEADAHTYACFSSAGGQGLSVLVPIPVTDHLGSFRALAAYYHQAHGVTVDPACKDVSRLRFVSYDPALYLNEAALAFETTLLKPSRAPSGPPVAASTWRASTQGDGYGQRALERACEKVRAAAEGEKHTVLNTQAYLCGGYIGAGFLKTVEAQQALEAAIGSRRVVDLPAAFNTIAGALQDGQRQPVLPWDLQYQVRQQLRRGVSPDAVVSTLAATHGLLADALKPAVRTIVAEQHQQVTQLLYWEMIPSGRQAEAPLKPKLRVDMLRDYLARHGFRKLLTGQRVRLVRQCKQVVYEVSRSQLKDFLLAELQQLPFEFDGTYRDRIEELVQLHHHQLSEEGMSEFLPNLSGNFLRDTAHEAYLFFRNGVVVATKDGLELRPYAKMPGLVWAEQVCPRDFTVLSQAEIASGEFFRFLQNLAAQQPERLRALLLFLGYYLHGYKDPSNPKVGVLVDEYMGPDGQANGGTGKSLLFEALSKLLPVVAIDGRIFDPRGTKELQEVKDSTRIIFFDDWNPQLPFERLFVLATGTLVVDRLYLGKQSYAFADSPKIGITSNGVLTGQGGSHDRRRYEVEVSPYYGPHRQPRDEFGHNFFTTAWPPAEWACFDALMGHACCLYLGTDGRLDTPVSVGLEQRRLLAATSEGFVAFMDSQARGQRLDRKTLLSEFRVAEGYDERAFSPEKFGRWLNVYKKLSTEFETGQSANGNRWIMLVQPLLDGATK
jgi:hypothetical protein